MKMGRTGEHCIKGGSLGSERQMLHIRFHVQSLVSIFYMSALMLERLWIDIGKLLANAIRKVICTPL